jgi:hypothetical protein
MSYRITREGTFAFNRITKERMRKPVWPSYTDYAHDSEWYPAYYRYVSEMKLWDAFVKALPDDYRYERPKLTHATVKGVPVAGIRSGGRRKYKNGAGVSANSRVLSHHYRDEGERGKAHRREIKRKERAMWLREWQEEQENQGDPYGYDWTDYDALTDPYDFYDVEEYECPYCMGPCEL